MRKVKVTKQQTVNPKAVYMGLSISQIVTMAVGIAIALGIVGVFIFWMGMPVNLTMSIVFIELLVFVGVAVVRINGLNLFKWMYVIFQSPIFRPYISKGALDTYVEKEE